MRGCGVGLCGFRVGYVGVVVVWACGFSVGYVDVVDLRIHSLGVRTSSSFSFKDRCCALHI